MDKSVNNPPRARRLDNYKLQVLPTLTQSHSLPPPKLALLFSNIQYVCHTYIPTWPVYLAAVGVRLEQNPPGSAKITNQCITSIFHSLCESKYAAAVISWSMFICLKPWNIEVDMSHWFKQINNNKMYYF